MLSLGLLGKDIQHSQSKSMYEKIYSQDVNYRLFDFSCEDSIPPLPVLFNNISGLSITAPYKKHFLSELIISEEIKVLNAVNCIRKNEDTFYGTNTDYLAVEEILHELKFMNKNIFILGDGSMAGITKLLLSKHKKNFSLYSRKNDGDLSAIDFKVVDQDAQMLIINSCSRTFKFQGSLPKNSIFWDYNYSHTFHEESLNSRCHYIDGLDLLYRQAIHATKFWNF